VQSALRDAGVALDGIDAIAVAQRPGLIGSLLIGVTAAKTLAWALGKPLVAVDHVQAHLYSVCLHDPAAPSPPAAPELPAVGLVCSGGHTALYRVRAWDDVRLVGSTIDDAVGEAYDKVAALLGLPFPGGPAIDRLAPAGNPKAYDFPRSLLGRDSLDFSFSGLKTAVRYEVFGYQGRQRAPADLSPEEVADVAASFQAACIDVLIAKLRRAIESFGARGVIIGGGVSANRALRAASAERLAVPVHLPAPRFCTDNAAMIAGLGQVHLSAGRVAGLDLDAVTHSEIARIDEGER
jgi:N6-L-threonylcarbamoyladenine synthase